MQCLPCERGRFNSQRIAAKCRPYPSGTYSATGATECLVCGLWDVSQRTVTAGQHLAVRHRLRGRRCGRRRHQPLLRPQPQP